MLKIDVLKTVAARTQKNSSDNAKKSTLKNFWLEKSQQKKEKNSGADDNGKDWGFKVWEKELWLDQKNCKEQDGNISVKIFSWQKLI